MPPSSQHDAYAPDYDRQVRLYGCYLEEALFGLCYEYLQPGQSLLDLGIGSGLSALPFAKAGLRVHGADFSPAMLELCRAKGIAVDLKRLDLQNTPWPYPSESFDHAVCCGVLHFLPELEAIFSETRRLLRDGGVFAFTTKAPAFPEKLPSKYETQSVDGLEVYSHAPGYVDALIAGALFEPRKTMRAFVAQDLFTLWVVQKIKER